MQLKPPVQEVKTNIFLFRAGLKVNDKVDALDNPACLSQAPAWYEGTVVGVTNTHLKVSFHAWKSEFDEWIPRMSQRILPRYSETSRWREQLDYGNRVEFNPPGDTRWYIAHIYNMNEMDITLQYFVKTIFHVVKVSLFSKRLTYLGTHHKWL